ncbi:MAG: SCO family protein [Candidatus Solibacter sp.]
MSATLSRCEVREAQFAAEIAVLMRGEVADAQRTFIGLCDERNAAYTEQPASAVTRMRAWVLESLCRVAPLPDEALPFVLEELETAHDPYLLAVAAWCLRTYTQPLPSFAAAVSLASRNAQAMDAPVMLGVYGGAGPAGGGNSSALREVSATVEWMGPHAVVAAGACCPELPESIAALFRRKVSTVSRGAVDRVALQDHRGDTKSFRERFRGQPTIVAFFYSRCDNPYKCTLTVAKLGRVQAILEERGLFERIRTTAISYDAAYDTPERLLRYGRNRGFRVDSENHAMLRAPEGFDVLRRHFELGVSFFDSLVSRHRIEVFVLDGEGRVAFTFQRLNWSEQKAVDEAEALLGAAPKSTVRAASAAPMAGLAASLIPKCPMCWATYLSFVGVTGTLPALNSVALKAVAAALLTLHVLLALWRVRATGWHMSHTLSVAGALAMAANLVDPVPGLAVAAVALMLLASILTVRRQYAR